MKRVNRMLVAMLGTAILSAHGIAAETLDSEKSLNMLNWQFEYDQDGRITKLVDPGGKTTQLQYSFDEQKRLRKLTRNHADGTKVVYEFDERGRRVKMTDSLGIVLYDYDEFNHLTGVRRDGQPAITYGFDTFDRLTLIGVGEEFRTRYEYDFLGRLAAIDSPAGKVTYEYQAGQGKVIRTLPNGIWTVWEYSPDGSLKSLTHVAKDNKVILKFEYDYRPDGLIQQIKEWSPEGEKTVAYEYDKVQRLITVTDSRAGTTRYAYDPLGNRTALTGPDGKTVASEYDWAGRLRKHDGQDCVHDNAGNLTAYPGPRGPLACQYDAANLLKSVTTEKGRVEYQHDGQGLLVTRLADGKQTSFVPDALARIWRPLIVTGTDNERTFYVWEGERPLTMIQGNVPKFFLEDHLGSVRCIANDQGKVVRRFNYSPFGLPRTEFAESGVEAGFAGLFFDAGSRLYLTRARGYDPWLERFLRPDPTQRVPGSSAKLPSLYGYSDGDPLNFLDNTGSEPHWVWGPENWAWQIARHPIDVEYTTGQLLNFVGNGWSDWFGANRGGGQMLYGQDQFGRFPLGETMVPGRNLVDAAARWHDIQDYVNWHAPQGTWVTVPGPYGTEYFESRGQGSSAHNWEVAGKVIVSIGQQLVFPEIASMLRDEWAQTTQRPPPNATVFSLKEVQAGLPTAFDREDYQSRQFRTGERPTGSGVTMAELPILERERKWKRQDDLFPPWFPPPPPPPGGGGGGAAVGGFGGGGHDDWFPPPPNGGGTGALDPSNVGGVALRGAGEALRGLGQLEGVAVDSNDQLILISKERTEIGLPPLRLDDVVTVFRSVYVDGQAPFVSIDPNPQDPRGPLMITRQAPATANTYPQWVLFEGDRVMKAYSLGMDNITRQPVNSAIPGYQSLLDLGFSNMGGPAKESDWERFWIVPAEVNRHQATTKQLTLLDVPLKVRTERMVLRNGKLETAPNATPSPQAQTFATWFTKNYAQLCQEVRSQPPKEGGLDAPIALYAELQRIALITGIAEALRDQGVPLPAWMRDYPVKPCPVPPTTPAITVQKSQSQTNQVAEQNGTTTITQTQIHQIYGGADLGVPDKDLHTFPSAPQAESLAKALPAMVPANGPIAPVSFDKDGKRYQALALPGSGTRALGACRLAEADLVVPVQGSSTITLVRRYSSFFQPSDGFGRGWTLDLPHLEEWHWPVERSDRAAKLQSVFALTSPLNTWNEIFTKHKFVPEVNGELLAPNSPSSPMLAVADANDPRIGKPTSEVLFRDGGGWHFDAAGNLVAQVRVPLLVIYRRDADHRITHIEGWHGKARRADIQLQYDAAGRLIVARGSNGKAARYAYNAAGELEQVDRPDGKLGYRYQDGFVAAVLRNGQMTHEFEYDARGQLLSEKRGGSKLVYQVNAATNGVQIAASKPNPGTVEFAQYDAGLRPVGRVLPDGTKMQWRYSDNGAVEYSTASPTGQRYQASRSADGRQVSWRSSDSGECQATYDLAGRVTALQQGGKEAAQFEWNPDGQLGTARYETASFHPQYGEDGVLTDLLVAPPEKGPKHSRWLNVKYDTAGRAESVTDYSGQEVRITYDKEGQPVTLTSKNGRVAIKRDNQGNPLTMQTSWGAGQRWTFDPKTGDLQKLEFTQGQAKASVELDGGRPTRIQHFGDGKTEISYYGEGQQNGLPKQVRTPNDVVVKYDYDTAARLATVECAGIYRLQFSYDEKGRLTGLAQTPTKPSEHAETKKPWMASAGE